MTSLLAVVGASMGGMQALQWGVSHPDFMRAMVAMTPMARAAPWSVAVVETARRALLADPAWDGEEFTDLSRARLARMERRHERAGRAAHRARWRR